MRRGQVTAKSGSTTSSWEIPGQDPAKCARKHAFPAPEHNQAHTCRDLGPVPSPSVGGGARQRYGLMVVSVQAHAIVRPCTDTILGVRGSVGCRDPVTAVGRVPCVGRAGIATLSGTRPPRLQKLMVLGEAAGRISEEVRSRWPDVGWRKIVGFRNLAIHAYFEIEFDRLEHRVNSAPAAAV